MTLPQYATPKVHFTTASLTAQQISQVVQIGHTAVTIGNGLAEFDVADEATAALVAAYLREQQVGHNYTVPHEWTGPHEDDD